MSRENFFNILELSPDENNQKVIENAIKKKQAEWSKLRNHPSKGRIAQKNLSLLKEIKKVMLDPSLRKQEALKLKSENQKNLQNLKNELKKQIELLSSKGVIYESELNELKSKFKELKNIESEIKVKIVKDAIRPGMQKFKYPKNFLPVLESSTTRKIESSLRLLNKRDLYHFLGVYHDSDINKIKKITEKKYIQNNKSATKTAEVTATSELLGMIKSILYTPERKKLYDNYLVMKKLKEINDLIEISAKNGIIEKEEYKFIYSEGILNKINKDILKKYIRETAKINNIKLEEVNTENIKIPSKDSEEQLFNLIRTNEPRDIEELVKNNPNLNLNTKNKNGTTPLILATYKGLLKIVKILVENGADVNLAGNDQTTPLIWAVIGEHTPIVRYLLNNGADINKTDKYGFTPLMWAASKGNETLVKILLQYNADTELKNKSGETAYEVARKNGYIRLFYLIKDHKGSDKKELTEKIFKAVENNDLIFLSKQYGIDFTKIRNESQDTILHTAIRLEKRDITDWIITNKKVDINSTNNNGYTPLIEAIIKNDEITVDKLLKQLDININKQDNNGYSPLMWAVQTDNLYIIKLLINKGANLDLKDKNNNSALSIAVWQNKVSIAKYLIDRGADTDIKTLSGKSLLDLAKERNNKEMINLLSNYLTNTDISSISETSHKNHDSLKRQNKNQNLTNTSDNNIPNTPKDKTQSMKKHSPENKEVEKTNIENKNKKKKKPWWKFW